MVMKPCTVKELGNIFRKLKSKFCNSHRFQGNRLRKLTKKCLKGLISGKFNTNEKLFGNVSSLEWSTNE